MAADRAAARQRARQPRRESPARHRIATFREQKLGRSRRGIGRERRCGQDVRDPCTGEAAEEFRQARSDADGNAHCGRGLGELGVSRTGGFGGDGLGKGGGRNFDFGNNNNTGQRSYEDDDLVEA